MRNNDILLITPDNLFQLIETAVTKRPELLVDSNWHESLKKGQEVFTEDQILDKDTAHDLAGWIVKLTPRAAQYERLRVDVDDYANDILKMNGRRPIPLAIHHSDVESMLKVIRMRAAEERVEEARNPKSRYN